MAVHLLKRRLFTVEEYYRMAEAGIISTGERLELIEGEVVAMAAIGSRHAACVDRLNYFLSQRVGGRALVRVQNPIRLDQFSEPQPDIALLRPRADFYAFAHPGPADVFLVVEVADTSAGFDRDVKIPLYARAGIPEAWLVDLTGDYVMVYRKPSVQVYQDVQRLQRGQSLSREAFPDLILAVEDILGQP
jgi:Uma2 family endonuclease